MLSVHLLNQGYSIKALWPNLTLKSLTIGLQDRSNMLKTLTLLQIYFKKGKCLLPI